MKLWSRVTACSFTALGFVASEACVGGLRPGSGMPETAGDALIACGVMGGLGALVGALPKGERILPLLLLAVAAPRAARIGDADLVGVAVFLMGCLLVWLWPLGALLLAALSGGLTPALAPLPLQRPAPPPGGVGGPDILLLSVDTLRADAALALPPGDWLVFEQAVASAPWTLPSMESVLLGVPARHHGGGLAVGEGYTRPSTVFHPLPERLAERGYHTGAFVSNPHLRAEFGFDQGFERFDHSDAWVEPFALFEAFYLWRFRLTGQVERLRHDRDELLVSAALRWWQSEPGPKFAWVHLLLPHEYQRDPRRAGDPATAYAANVRSTEATVRRLLAGVEADTLVAVCSDHGESLGEEGLWGHGSALNDAQLRVPLALRGFGTGEVTRQVALTDLAYSLEKNDITTLVRGRPVVEVGALRRDPSVWATRVEGGAYTPRTPPDGWSGSSPPISDSLRTALQSLGYTDE